MASDSFDLIVIVSGPAAVSFNGRFRDECLNEHWFEGLEQAREVIEEWRLDYNQVRRTARSGICPPRSMPQGC
jgi:transposase InsO family protein